MQHANSQQRMIATRRVAIMGIFANLALMAAKLVVGFMAQSQALLADGANSAGDVFSSVMTYLGGYIAGKPKDDEHPFGHGKAEYIFSFVIALSLLLVAGTLFYSSLQRIFNGSHASFSYLAVGVAGVTIAVKSALYLWASRMGRRANSLLITANAEDHRNDVVLSIGTLVSIIMTRFGVLWVDGVVGALIALWIARSGIVILRPAYRVLLDTNINNAHEEDYRQHILSVAGVDHIDALMAKPVGVRFLLLVKISVDADMSVAKSHAIANEIKRVLMSEHEDLADVVVHINPVFPNEQHLHAHH